MPAPVFLRRRRVAEIVLLAQLVGDVRRCRLEVAARPHYFGTAATVVGDFAQCMEVDALVSTTLDARPSLSLRERPLELRQLRKNHTARTTRTPPSGKR